MKFRPAGPSLLLSLLLSFSAINIFGPSVLYAGGHDKCRCPYFIFSEGNISTGTGNEERKVELSGELLAYDCSGKSIYYLTGAESDDPNDAGPVERSFHLGFFQPGNEGEERKFAAEIKLLHAKGGAFKVIARGENVFILNGSGILYHVNLNSMAVSQREGVSDAALAGMTLVLLKEEGRVLNINGKHLPLTITGKSRIKSVADNRLVSLTDGEETELVDTLTGESVYQYSSEGTYLVSPEYNLIISAHEEVPEISRPGTRPMVFYKVFIDGIETGRTETGISGAEKFLRTRVTPGGYHVVRLERWELKRNRYRRSNNLYQPESLRIYLPLKRTIKLEVKYNGSHYSFSKRALKK